MAKFKKGQSGNPVGRPKGIKDKRITAWENLGDFLTKDGAERAKRVIDESTDEEFMRYYFQLVEYFQPKQQRSTVDLNAKVDKPVRLIKLPDGGEIEI